MDNVNRQIDIYNILKKGRIFDFKSIDNFNNKDFPDNGVYLMMEKTEKNRISRIGINKKRKLKIRLLKHLQGSIRNSIFRKHLYRVLGSEEKVSSYIKNNISFYIISDPENKRIDLESKLISSFSVPTIKKISKEWLGLKSDNKKIHLSGLWNVQHVFSDKEITNKDIEYIERYLRKIK